jgi:DNA-directed RNA polymerase subunit RPC12/RpoP
LDLEERKDSFKIVEDALVMGLLFDNITISKLRRERENDEILPENSPTQTESLVDENQEEEDMKSQETEIEASRQSSFESDVLLSPEVLTSSEFNNDGIEEDLYDQELLSCNMPFDEKETTKDNDVDNQNIFHSEPKVLLLSDMPSRKGKDQGSIGCNKCNSKLMSTGSLSRHMKTVHAAFTEIFDCKYCGKLFARKDTMQLHERRFCMKGERRKDDQLVQCTYCDYRIPRT